MDGGDLVSAVFRSVVEGVSGDSFGSVVSDQLDRLDDTVNDLKKKSIELELSKFRRPTTSTYLVFDTTVFTLGVFSDQNGVDVVIGSLVTLDGNTRSNVGEQGECPSQGQVEGNVTLSD